MRTRGEIPAAILALALAAAAPSSARASEPEPSGPRSEFWRNVVEPGRGTARAILAQTMEILASLDDVTTPWDREARLEAAIRRLFRAHRLAPDDPEILFYLAYASSERVDATSTDRALEGARLFEGLRARDPSYRAETVAFQLGVLYTRLRRFDRARDEYRRSIEAAFESEESPAAYSNLAEVTMLGGDLEGAAHEYDRAVEVARRSTREPRNLVLALFGSAVALDRLGEHATAIDRAREAVSLGGGLSVLRSEGVFFEPEHELYYYLGLGHLAVASEANEPWRRRQALEWAEQAFQRFLDDGGANGPYAELARAHVNEARAALRASEAAEDARPPRRRPR